MTAWINCRYVTHSDAKAMMGMMDSTDRHKEILMSFHYTKTNVKNAHMMTFQKYIIIGVYKFKIRDLQRIDVH